MPGELFPDERERRVFGQVIRRLVPFIFLWMLAAGLVLEALLVLSLRLPRSARAEKAAVA